MKFRTAVKSIARLHPWLEGMTVGLYRAYIRARARNLSGLPDPFRLYWLDPRSLTKSVCGSLNRMGDVGRIHPGDWDRSAFDFESWSLFQGFVDRFKYGCGWEDTEYYQQVLHEIYDDRRPWTIWKSKDEFDERCKYWDKVFKEVQEYGYRTQAELDPKDRFQLGAEDEVAVRVDRDGHPLVECGAHRLAIAKILGIDKIPIRITVRHRKWYTFRQEVQAYACEKGLYQPLTHFDLADLCTGPAEAYKIAEIIRSHLPIHTGRLLDIGANWGFYCHRLEEYGFECIAVESHPMHIYFLEKLRRAENRQFKIIAKSAFDCQPNELHSDVVLALNIFHHLLKTEETYAGLLRLLALLDAKYMIFEPYGFDRKDLVQMEDAYKTYSPQEFVDFILDNSGFSSSALIGHDTILDRPIYLLSVT